VFHGGLGAKTNGVISASMFFRQVDEEYDHKGTKVWLMPGSTARQVDRPGRHTIRRAPRSFASLDPPNDSRTLFFKPSCLLCLWGEIILDPDGNLVKRR